MDKSPGEPLSKTVQALKRGSFFTLAACGLFLVFSNLWLKFGTWLTRDRSADWWAASGEWAGALGTTAAVVVALWVAGRDAKKSREELAERIERETRDHVSHISALPLGRVDYDDDLCWYGIRLLNSSNEQFYNVVAVPVFIQGAGAHTGEDWVAFDREEQGGWVNTFAVISTLPPGRWKVQVVFDDGILMGRPGVEIACTDRYGKHWIRRTTGKLEQIDQNPIEYYKIWLPINYLTPEEVG